MSFVYHFGAITLFLIAFIIVTLLVGCACGCHSGCDIDWKDAFLGAYITATLIALGLYIILMSATGKWDLPKNSNIIEIITEESNDDTGRSDYSH